MHASDADLPREFYSNVPWDYRTPRGAPIHHVGPGIFARWAAFCKLTPLSTLCLFIDTFFRAVRLWWASRRTRSVVFLNLGERGAFAFGLLRNLWRTRGTVIASHIYLHRWPWWKRWLIHRALRTVSAIAVWSDYQVRQAEKLFGPNGPRFVRVPYKANHSQQQREPALPIGEYVFSGGNTERDYRTFFAAMDGLPMRGIVSCTDSSVLRGLTVPVNVIVVAAREPHFRRLMVGARIVVLCIKPGLLRGAGEATFLNAMWHGRPVVVTDDGSAKEYLEDGVTGYVLAAEDEAGLRKRLLQLWDDERLCQRIGDAGRRLVEEEYTGQRWREHMMELALNHAKPQAAIDYPSLLSRSTS